MIERADGNNLNIYGLNYEDARDVYNFLCKHTGSKCMIKANEKVKTPRVKKTKKKTKVQPPSPEPTPEPVKKAVKPKKQKAKKSVKQVEKVQQQQPQALYPNLKSSKPTTVPEYKLPQNVVYHLPQQRAPQYTQLPPQREYHPPPQYSHQHYHHHQPQPQVVKPPPSFQTLNFPKIPDIIPVKTTDSVRKEEPLIAL